MPELPDLEVFKDNVFKRLTSKQLSGFTIINAKKVCGCEDDLMKELQGQELLSVSRVGKELLFNFSGQKVIAVHLMLSGRIDIVREHKSVDNIKFKIFSLEFKNEIVVFSDQGGLCTVRYMPSSEDGAPDALDDRFSLSYFLDIARKKPRTNIKAFLIDQKVVKGIGNAYADEILWDARISPRSVVGKIPETVMAALYDSIGSVLQSAIGSIKAISPDIISGEERSFLKVHNKKLVKTATGYFISVDKIASKTTYYTSEQVLYS